MKKIFALIIVLMLALSACAETLRFEGSVPTFNATDYANGSSLTVTAERLVLLGLTEEDKVLAYADGNLFVIEPEELTRVSDKIAIANLPVLDSITDIQRGSSSSSIEALQRALTLLGYMNSSVDGSFGSRTANAVSAFQADRGLEETGVADAITQRLLFSLAGADTVITANTDPVDQFAAIKDRTEANLEVLEEQGLSFEYDDISGTGFIGNGSTVTIASGAGTADVDSYTFTLRFGLAVAEGKEAVTVTPVIEITNTSVRRPIMQNVLIKSGDSRVTIKTTGVTSGVSGSKSIETGTVKLTDDAMALLSKCAEKGELKIRITGKYEAYDVNVSAGQLEKIAEMGRLAIELTRVVDAEE